MSIISVINQETLVSS